jgi:AcrR family transcriptional regulator
MDEIKSNLVILEVAERIFFQYGYSNTNMQEIANECGMSKKTIYKHFTSKEEILIECVKRKIDYNSKRISEIIYSEDIKFHEKIEKIIFVTSENFKEIDISFLYDIKKSCKEAWKLIENHKLNHIPKKFTYLISEGIKNGYVKKDVKAEIVAYIYLSAMLNLLDSSFFSNTSNYSFLEIIKEIDNTIFYGVIKRV